MLSGGVLFLALVVGWAQVDIHDINLVSFELMTRVGAIIGRCLGLEAWSIAMGMGDLGVAGAGVHLTCLINQSRV